ncbi:MAG: class I SAM-dependent methyltransferase, partial [Gemmatimonadaceae bacterium]
MLVARAPEGSLQTTVGDLLDFRQNIDDAPSAILCMGDTITHLPDFAAVQNLVEYATAALRIGGLFVTTFRDYSQARVGDERFIPVRSDDHRTLTCYLEYEQDVVQVYDILNERGDDGWKLRVSHYPKLRLAPMYVIQLLEFNGFKVQRDVAANSMVRLVAERIR